MTFLLRPVMSFDFRETTITTVIEDPKGHTIYVGNASADLASFDIRIGKLLGSYLGKCSGSIRFVAIHPQHQVIASCGLDRHLRVYVVSEDTPAHLCGFLEAASYRFCFRLRLQWRRFVFYFCLTSYGRITYMHVLYIHQASKRRLTFELICQELKKMEQLTKLGREVKGSYGDSLDFEISEDERRRSKIRSLKQKAINASTKFTYSLKKRGKRKIDYRIPSVSIEDVRDEKEDNVVLEFRHKLLERDLLHPRHDEYHTLLRFLKARDLNIEKTIQMWEEMLRWRKEYVTETILEGPLSTVSR